MTAERDELVDQISGVATLNDPVRRALYQYVARHTEPVSRDSAADAVGITRSLAAFHLDKLAEEGLLDVEFRRLTGRSGPGAGRPSKLYRRSRRQLDLSLPPRSYELAARLLAKSLDDSGSAEAFAAVGETAHDFGWRLGSEIREGIGERDASLDRMDAVLAVLERYGFEPQRTESGEVRLRNCPFHVLSREHTALVCGMNLSMLRGVVDGMGLGDVEAVLDPVPGQCCVAFRPQKTS